MATKEGTRTGPSDPRAEQAADEARARPARSYGGVRQQSKQELLQDAAEAGIEGRTRMTKEQLADALQRYNDRATARAREDR